jgi:beta-lactamase regulating signal transducer with metallopeptidase domain
MTLVTLVFVAAVKGSVLLLAAWVATRLAPRMSAAFRHLLWTSALVGLVLMPVLLSVVPSVESRFVPAIPTVASIETTPVAAVMPTRPSATKQASAIRETAEPVRPTVATRTRSFDVSHWLPLAWATVAALLLLRVALARLKLALLARQASVVDDGEWLLLVQRLAGRLDIARPVRLLRSPTSCVPMTWGLIYPTVMLPIDSDDWPADRRTIVLLHELAHVNRLDAFTQSVARVATAIFWFNPLVWVAARAMRVERELACDDCVLASGARPSDYAQDLLQIARSFSRRSDVAVAALAMARRGDLEERLMAILDPAADRRAVSRWRTVGTAAAIVALALPLAALTPAVGGAAAAPTPEQPSSTHQMAPTSRHDAVVAAPPRSSASIDSPSRIKQMLMLPLGGVQQMLMPEARDSVRAAVTLLDGPLPALRRRTAPTAEVPDRETLLSVARAAAKLTSSYDKAELLVPIAKYYTRDAELTTAYLDAAASMAKADYDCSRTLMALLKADMIGEDAIARALETAAVRISSDYEKANIVVAAFGDGRALGPDARASAIKAVGTIRSDYEKRRSIEAVIKRGQFNDLDAGDLIAIASTIKSSYEKAEALVGIARHYQDMHGTVRQAYLTAAESITSSSDYRRAVEAVIKQP